ncbi:overlapping protein/movement protein [Chayote mosaic virus]|uniref:Overlapping protein n=1 Tax=Chayote mosaic virus TaxID=71030 RepID=Q9QCX4_9VIRU|nr:overlapping protein/movement protein [Chayote mosaic virus]AAF09239.1 overlapping protein [Chayote mosaic virus]
MSNVVPTSLGRSLPYYSPGLLCLPGSGLCVPTTPLLHSGLPMDSPKGTPAVPHPIRDPNLRIRFNPPPSPSSQGPRDQPSVQPLEPPLPGSLDRAFHEALKIQEASGSQPPLLPTPQLPAVLRRHSPVPHHQLYPPHLNQRVHARRADVLPPQSNTGPLSPMPPTRDALLQSRDSPRVRLHGLLPLPSSVPIPSDRLVSPLHPRKPSRRQLQPAFSRPKLVESALHHLSPPHSQHHQAGVLGPPPLHSSPERPSSPTPSFHSCSSSVSSTDSLPLNPLFLRLRFDRQSPILPDPGLLGAAPSHLPPPTSPSSSRSHQGVRGSVHLHSGRPNPSRLGSRRLRSHAQQQTRALLGNVPSLGQSTNVRPAKRPHPTPRHVQLLPQPGSQAAPSRSTTLAVDPTKGIPCVVRFGSLPPLPISPDYPPSPLGKYPRPPPYVLPKPRLSPKPPSRSKPLRRGFLPPSTSSPLLPSPVPAPNGKGLLPLPLPRRPCKPSSTPRPHHPHRKSHSHLPNQPASKVPSFPHPSIPTMSQPPSLPSSSSGPPRHLPLRSPSPPVSAPMEAPQLPCVESPPLSPPLSHPPSSPELIVYRPRRSASLSPHSHHPGARVRFSSFRSRSFSPRRSSPAQSHRPLSDPHPSSNFRSQLSSYFGDSPTPSCYLNRFSLLDSGLHSSSVCTDWLPKPQ